MSTVIQISIFVFTTLFLSCVNTKKTSNNSLSSKASTTESSQTKETLVETPDSAMTKLNEMYLTDEIYLAIKEDSGIKLATDLESITDDSKSPLLAFSEEFSILDIQQPLLGLKPNLYRVTFSEGTDLAAAIKALEAYSFVQYAELIPLNK